MNGIGEAIASIAAAIIGLAIISVIVSKNANTSGVLQAGGSALGGLIQAAVSPVSNSSGNQFGIGG